MDINLRKLTLKILEDIYNNQTFINDAINHHFDEIDLDKQQRSFVSKIVNGTLDNQIKLDYIINQFSKVKVKKLKRPILYVLRMSIYQLLYMDSIPDSAVCNEAVKLVKKRKMGNLSGYVNGVLRSISRNINDIEFPSEENDPNTFLSITYSFPMWLINYLLQQYDYKVVKQICEDSIKAPRICIRHNSIKCSIDELLSSLDKENITYEKGNILPYAYYIHGVNQLSRLESFNNGFFQVQDESSMLVGEVAGPKQNDTIIDVCAAPGGKTTHLADLMKNTGKIYSRDVSNKKLKLIEDNCRRLGIKNTEISNFDATLLDQRLIESADIVVTDVPCSGLGIMKKKPDIKINVTEEGIKSLIKIQRMIMSICSNYVKKDGVMIYSTCTINYKENYENVQWFLKNNDNFRVEAIEIRELSNVVDYNGTIQLLPIHNISDGFYIAKLRRMS